MKKLFYVKERSNPQCGTYWVAEGQLSKAEAKAKTKTLYGSNTMHSFSTQELYAAFLAQLRADGKRVQP